MGATSAGATRRSFIARRWRASGAANGPLPSKWRNPSNAATPSASVSAAATRSVTRTPAASHQPRALLEVGEQRAVERRARVERHVVDTVLAAAPAIVLGPR